MMTVPERRRTKARSKKTVAETLGYSLQRADMTTTKLTRLIRSLCYFDALVCGQFMLEYVKPDYGYPYYLLWYRQQFVGIVHLRANGGNPDEIRRRLPKAQAKLASFLAEIGFEPERCRVIVGGARSKERDNRRRVKHLF